MVELAEGVLVKRGIVAQWIAGSDDSSMFISHGVPTVVLGRQPTGHARPVIHTPLDTAENLHMEAVHEGVDVLLEIVRSIPQIQLKENRHVYAR